MIKMPYPRYDDMNNAYICACGLDVTLEEYHACRYEKSHKSSQKSSHAKEFNFKEYNDDNIIGHGLEQNGIYFEVYDRASFMRKYGSEDWIDKVNVYQRPANLFDFKFMNATESDISNAIAAYLHCTCISTAPCTHKVVIRIKENGLPDEIYRSTSLSAPELYGLQQRGILDIGLWPDDHFSEQLE